MAHRHTGEFRREAVPIALKSGFSRKQVAFGMDKGAKKIAPRKFRDAKNALSNQ